MRQLITDLIVFPFFPRVAGFVVKYGAEIPDNYRWAPEGWNQIKEWDLMMVCMRLLPMQEKRTRT